MTTLHAARASWPSLLIAWGLTLTWPSGSFGQAPAARLVVLGTGTPYADPDRSGPALAVVVGDDAYLVDAGPGIVRRAAAASQKDFPALNPTNLKRVFLTHLHSDHTLGLPDLMFSPWTLGRRVPLEVYGPPGTRQMTSHLERAWAEDIRVRLFGLEAGRQHNYRAVVQEIKAGRIYDDGKVRVEAIPVAHASWASAFGYRFVTPNRTIVISGDARPSESLVRACNRCDILVHEVYSSVFFKEQPNQAYHGSAHTSTSELAEIAKRAQPALLVLYHQLYGRATDDDLKREIREAGYNGRVESARDLDVF
jgi:ribonuclease BN (tRNA processing enzyme)